MRDEGDFNGFFILMGSHFTDRKEKGKSRLRRVAPMTPDDYRNNRIVTAERMAEIDRKLAEILPKLKDGQITPGRPPKDWPSGIKR